MTLSCAEVLGVPAGSIDVTIIRELMLDAWREANDKYIAENPDRVRVSVHRSAGNASVRKPPQRVHYHRQDCQHFDNNTRGALTMRIGREFAEAQGFQPCVFCCTLTVASWAEQIGLDRRYVWAIVSGKRQTVKRNYAVRLLNAIGEPPHPSLLDTTV